jgi:serine/threonine protein kinase
VGGGASVIYRGEEGGRILFYLLFPYSWSYIFVHFVLRLHNLLTSIYNNNINYVSFHYRDIQLGEGAFSVVVEATKKDSTESYAVKVVTKSKLTKEDEIALKDEINILNELRHQHIIRLYDVFDESQYWYLVTEKMTGGELFDRIVSKSYYNEKEARDVCKILFEAVGYCHSKCVAHRDLKPENLLLRSEDSDSDIKIADFGFAKKVLTPNSLTTQCGTPGYVAPEILEGIAYGEVYVTLLSLPASYCVK